MKKSRELALALTGAAMLAHGAAEAKTPVKHLVPVAEVEERVELNTNYHVSQYVLNRTVSVKGQADQRNILHPVIMQRRGNGAVRPTVTGVKRGDFAFVSIDCNRAGNPIATARVFDPHTMQISTSEGEMTPLRPAIELDTLIKPTGLDPAVTAQTKIGPIACYHYAITEGFDLRVDPGGAPAQMAFEYPVFK